MFFSITKSDKNSIYKKVVENERSAKLCVLFFLRERERVGPTRQEVKREPAISKTLRGAFDSALI